MREIRMLTISSGPDHLPRHIGTVVEVSDEEAANLVCAKVAEYATIAPPEKAVTAPEENEVTRPEETAEAVTLPKRNKAGRPRGGGK